MPTIILAFGLDRVECEYGLGLRLCVSLNDIIYFLYTLCKGIRPPAYISVNI
jgi:hypothetical protein